jgi:hypothetical protein
MKAVKNWQRETGPHSLEEFQELALRSKGSNTLGLKAVMLA